VVTPAPGPFLKELKMPTGRPSKYKAEYCKVAIEFMRDGYSVTAFAGHIGVARSTVFKWAEEHAEFSDALKTAQALAALWWEKALRQVASTGEGNATACIFGVKNRSTEDWRDKHDHELTGANGAPLEFAKIERVVISGKDT